MNDPKDTPIIVKTDVPKAQEIDAAQIAKEASKIAKEELQGEFDSKAEEIAQEAARKTKEEIAKQISGEKDADKWVPKSYEEIVDKAKDEMREENQKTQKDADEQREADEKKAGEDKKKSLEKWNKHWDTQIKTLEKDGIIEEVNEDIQKKLDNKEELTDEEKNDPGLKSREQIFSKARELKETNLELVAYKYIKGEKKASGRSSAPVIGSNRGGFTPGNKSGYSYEEVHDSSIEDILRGK